MKLLVALACLALNPPAARAGEEIFTFTVTKGEAVTVFRVEQRGERASLSRERAGEPRVERTLSADDLSYLKEKARAVPAAREAGCGRSSFRLGGRLAGGEKVACGERLSAAGAALVDLANLLTAFH